MVDSLVQSENNYLDSLSRLISDYKRPLEASNPPILSDSKVSTMFYRVPEILQIHSQFRIALTEAIKNWDEVRNILHQLLKKYFTFYIGKIFMLPRSDKLFVVSG